jgi:GR25 family glycosyltransferase involved in LPS biosynthesis
MDKIDNIYIINLEERPDRWRECIEQLNNYNINNSKYTRFNAIKPNLTTYNKNVYTGFNKILSRKKNYIQGALGCKLSHMTILEKYKRVSNKTILILEDDFVLCKNFKKEFENIITYLDTLSSWNMCYLGFSMNSKHNSKTLDLNSELENNTTNKIKILKKCHTTHAYIINTSFIPQLLDICNNEPKEIDVCYTIAQEKYEIYGIYPCLITQKEGFSNILNKNVNYTKLINTTN